VWCEKELGGCKGLPPELGPQPSILLKAILENKTFKKDPKKKKKKNFYLDSCLALSEKPERH
jgi:hypothetical protein